MAESSNKSHFMDLTVRRLYYSSIRLDYFFILPSILFHCSRDNKFNISAMILYHRIYKMRLYSGS